MNHSSLCALDFPERRAFFRDSFQQALNSLFQRAEWG
jgi:hypothetical protein